MVIAHFRLIVAVVQVVGALFLLPRKTLMAGVTILILAMLNITILDILYGMNPGALLEAVVLKTGLLFLLLRKLYLCEALF